MKLRRAIASAFVALAATLPGQDPAHRRIPLRVTTSGPRASAVVDRGKNDKLAIGDVVILRPRAGGEYRGHVVRLDDRTATVEMIDREFLPPPGTRGEALVPSKRFPQRPADPEAPPPPPQKDPARQPEQPPTEHPPWRNRDPNWQPGKPLLSGLRPLRPGERPTTIEGRLFAAGDLTGHPESDLDESFLRTGTDVQVDNPFGLGGGLQFSGEYNYRTEQNDDSGNNVVVQRLSYRMGGDRFSDMRLEVGRFLQHGMPEFGVLDGGEWTRRLSSGHRVGVSLGFMPRPNDDLESFDDIQFGAYYLWTADQLETWTIGAGFQKIVHKGDSDRDLLVLKTSYLPDGGWHVHGTMWIDLYTANSSNVDLTQMLAAVGRSWQNGNRLELSFRRRKIPNIDRREFPLLPPAEIADERYDRLALDGWLYASPGSRLHGLIAGWSDEDTEGGALEAGIDMQDLLAEQSNLDVTLFANTGQFVSVVGGRVQAGFYSDDGRWDLFYELARHHEIGFPNDRDDLLQHRLRVSRSLYWGSGWDLTTYAEGRVWDEDLSWSLGFHVQKSF